MSGALKPYLPKKFKTLAAIERHKKLCLALPIKIYRKELPWGYYTNPENPREGLADEKAFKALLKAKEYLKESSYVDVSNWLKTCGFPISSQGLHFLMLNRPPFDEIELSVEERMKL